MGVVTEDGGVLNMLVVVVILVLVVVVVLGVVHLPQDAPHVLLHGVLDLGEGEVVAGELEAGLLLGGPVGGEMFLQDHSLHLSGSIHGCEEVLGVGDDTDPLEPGETKQSHQNWNNNKLKCSGFISTAQEI